jgi:Holliday junction resolvasome RuvABC endonuclease subunit
MIHPSIQAVGHSVIQSKKDNDPSQHSAVGHSVIQSKKDNDPS